MTDAVLVLGACGFVGRALVGMLGAQGIRVIAVGRGSPGIFRHPLVEPVDGVLATEESFAALLARSRAIVHVATTSTPGTSAARPLNEVDTNLRLTATLLQALQDQPQVELLYLSSGGSLYAGTSDAPAREDSALHPRSYHGAGKLAAEAFISAWCDQFGGRATILRPSNVYGPGQPERPGFGVIPAALGKILRNETLQVWGDGTVRRDYLYIDDLTRFCGLVLRSPMPVGARIFNACSGMSLSLQELFAAIESVTGLQLRCSYDASRAVDAPSIAMDASLAAMTYGWRHQTSIETGLKQTWERFRDAGSQGNGSDDASARAQ